MLARPSLLPRTLHFLVAGLIPDQGVVIRRTGRKLVLLALMAVALTPQAQTSQTSPKVVAALRGRGSLAMAVAAALAVEAVYGPAQGV